MNSRLSILAVIAMIITMVAITGVARRLATPSGWLHGLA
jgi:hypothetical protein